MSSCTSSLNRSCEAHEKLAAELKQYLQNAESELMAATSETKAGFAGDFLPQFHCRLWQKDVLMLLWWIWECFGWFGACRQDKEGVITLLENDSKEAKAQVEVLSTKLLESQQAVESHSNRAAELQLRR